MFFLPATCSFSPPPLALLYDYSSSFLSHLPLFNPSSNGYHSWSAFAKLLGSTLGTGLRRSSGFFAQIPGGQRIKSVCERFLHVLRFLVDASSAKMAVFWEAASCSLAEVDRRFGDAYCPPPVKQQPLLKQKTVIVLQLPVLLNIYLSSYHFIPHKSLRASSSCSPRPAT